MTPEVATILVHRRKSTNDQSATSLSNGNGPIKPTLTDSYQNGNILNETHSSAIEDSSSNYIEQITDEVTSNELTSKSIGTEIGFKREIVWSNAIGFLLLHVMGVVGLGVMGLGYARLFTCLYFVVLTILSGMGITMGAHRLFSHRSYKAKTWLKVTLIIMHTMAGQNCLYVWVRDHRQHHKYSDTDADPHNATRGFFFSHVGWLMSKKHPKVIEYGKKIDMSDLEADAWVMFQKKHYKILYTIFTLVLPTAIPCWVWGESLMVSWFATYFARYIVQLNFTWSVNSVAHMFGNKPYDKNLLPVESALVSMVAGGEGWHNYHHTFPWDYRTAELGMPYNLTTKIIDFLASKGSVYDRKTVSVNVLKNRILRTGDGTHEKYGNNVNATSNTNNENISNSTAEEIDNDAILRKYIVEKNHINKTFLITELEKAAEIDDFNNNENSTKSEQFMEKVNNDNIL